MQERSPGALPTPRSHHNTRCCRSLLSLPSCTDTRCHPPLEGGAKMGGPSGGGTKRKREELPPPPPPSHRLIAADELGQLKGATAGYHQVHAGSKHRPVEPEGRLEGRLPNSTSPFPGVVWPPCRSVRRSRRRQVGRDTRRPALVSARRIRAVGALPRHRHPAGARCRHATQALHALWCHELMVGGEVQQAAWLRTCFCAWYSATPTLMHSWCPA